MELSNAEGYPIYHMKAKNYRRLKKMVNLLLEKPIPKGANVHIQLLYFAVYRSNCELLAEVYVDHNNQKYQETIQTFPG